MSKVKTFLHFPCEKFILKTGYFDGLTASLE